MRGSTDERNTEILFVSLRYSPCQIILLSLFPSPLTSRPRALSWGQCTPVFASFASTETDDESAGSFSPFSSLSSSPSSSSSFPFFVRVVLFLSFFPRDVFLALRLAASLFPASSSREDSSRFGLNPSHTMKPKISAALGECGA